jgi:hypothetical protein
MTNVLNECSFTACLTFVNEVLMKNFILGVCAVVLISCGSYYRPPESIQSKMDRYEPKKKKTNIVPVALIKQYNFSNRSPASVKFSRKKKIGYSNKRLYFLTLYSQYLAMKRLTTSTNTPEQFSCPHFHTSLLTNKNILKKSKSLKPIELRSYDQQKFNDQSYLTSHLELILPMNNFEVAPKAVDILKTADVAKHKEIIKSALNTHVVKTFNEVKELCDYGSSDNYYSYETLISQNNEKRILSPSKNSLSILLKNPVFFNMALLKNLEKKTNSRSIASTQQTEKSDHLEREIIHRLNVGWSYGYYQ